MRTSIFVMIYFIFNIIFFNENARVLQWFVAFVADL